MTMTVAELVVGGVVELLLLLQWKRKGDGC